MSKRVCNKLIRDKVPNFIRAKGQIGEIIHLDDKQYPLELARKLSEETKEVVETFNDPEHLTEEICDLLEIIDAIINFHHLNKERILQLQKKKKETNGEFRQRLFLVSVTEP